MISRAHLNCLLLISLALISSRALAFQSDPYGGNSAPGTSGVLGVPLKEPDAPPEHVTGQAEGGKQLEFKSQTTLVRVPVIVTDSSGAHVHQLSKSDFKVLEDGKAQTIASFEEIIPDGTFRPTPWPSNNTFTNMTSDVSKANSVVVLLLDKVNTPFLSQADARRQLIKYLAEHLNSSQPMALMAITGKGLRVLSPFGTDPKVLMAALKKVSGEVAPKEQFSQDSQIAITDGEQPIGLVPIGMGEPPDQVIQSFAFAEDSVQGAVTQARTIETTLRAFLQMGWSLSGIPGRKSVIWVTGSFPFYLDSYTSVPGDPTLRALYERVLKSFSDAQVSIYPVDARGLLTDTTYNGTTGQSYFGPEGGGQLDQSTLESLKTFARMTGGVAYYQTNDLAGAVDRAVQDSSSYYLVTYYLNRNNNKPGWRQLQVQVARKDAKVRARAGFLVSNVAVNPELSHKADVAFALSSSFESTGVRITEHWLGASPSGDKKKVGFVVKVPADDLIDETDKNRFDVEFIAQAEKKGVAAGSVGQTLKGTAAPENLAQLKTDGVLYHNSLELAPGEYQVRFIVRDNLSGRIGSVIVPLTVN